MKPFAIGSTTLEQDTNPFIIGGGEIYKQALNVVDIIEFTRVHHSFEGDTFFPVISETIWKETDRIFHKKDDLHKFDFSYITYKRR